ncbi:wax ester synthase/diacylglycerol acyltransferase 4-like isoform X2 [Diospyros lotus]|uniref:wax ester synthase/diacylglycerol acyltransferase 4-like isoform X2 n=1 Tax=Diospyros lotus TaxID=55363 RepID=UPI00225186DA|nr:wax ester synthase/diacylglycerol acyltransferase 4-like isoform X2 [Diospyros lotus]
MGNVWLAEKKKKKKKKRLFGFIIYDRERSMESEPVSPTGQYFNSSVMSVSIFAVLEFEAPIDDSQFLSLLNNVFLPINPRFSSIMVGDKKGTKKWKRVEVKLEDHLKVAHFPSGMSPEFYDSCFDDYLSTIALEQFPSSRPLWELHVVKYATSNAAGNLVFKLHHSLGDGYSLMGALLSCLQRADDPSLPLTFPSLQSNSKEKGGKSISVLKSVPRVLSGLANTVLDLGLGFLKSNFVEDDRTAIRSGEDGVGSRPITITTLTFSLDQIKQIKAKLGVTINDVLVGTVFLGTRLYMRAERQEEGSAASTALVVLNTRALGGGDKYKTVSEMVSPKVEMRWGNHFSFLNVPIPKLTPAETESSSPISFVMKAHRIIKTKKNSAAAFLTGLLLEKMRQLRGSEATARYIHKTVKNSSMVISNLIGPMEEIALANQPIRGLYFALVGGPELGCWNNNDELCWKAKGGHPHGEGLRGSP